MPWPPNDAIERPTRGARAARSKPSTRVARPDQKRTTDDTAPIANGPVICLVRELDGTFTELRAMSETDTARYVSTQPEIARARAVLVEVYRRLTDYITPLCVVRQIDAEIDGLERWIGGEAPHLR